MIKEINSDDVLDLIFKYVSVSLIKCAECLMKATVYIPVTQGITCSESLWQIVQSDYLDSREAWVMTLMTLLNTIQKDCNWILM